MQSSLHSMSTRLVSLVLCGASLAAHGQDSPPSWLEKAEAHLKGEQHEAALANFEKALEADPKSYAVLVGIGRCRIALNDMDGAIDALLKAKAIDGSRADAVLYLGIASYYKAQALIESGAQATIVSSLYRDARAALEAAVSTDPKNVVGYEFLGLVRIQLEAYLDAEEALKKVIEIKPTDAFALYQLGEVAFLQLKYAEAVPRFEAAIRVSPKDPMSYQRLGYCHQFLEKPAKAEEVFRRAIQAIPDSQLAWDDLFNLYAGDNRYKEAVEAYKRLLQADPKNAKTHWYLGYVYRQVGVEDKAIEEFQKALEQSPRMFAALLQIGEIQKESGAIDAATKSFLKALTVAQEAGEDLIGHPIVTNLQEIAGAILPEQRRFDASIEIYKALTSAVPGDALIWSDYGLVLRDSNRFDESLKAYKKAVALMPEDPQILNDCGVVLDYHLHRAEEAVGYYTKAVETGQSVDAMQNLARYYVSKRRYEEALEMCNRALAIEPDRVEVRQSRDEAREGLKQRKGITGSSEGR